MGECVRRFERRNDSFKARERRECLECFPIGGRKIFYASMVFEPRVLRTDARIIEPRRNGMCFKDLAFVRLQQIKIGRASLGKECRSRGSPNHEKRKICEK